MKIRFKTSIWKIIGVAILVCSLQLYGQQTVSGAETEAEATKAITNISFDPPGSISTQPQAINPIGAITGYYQDNNGFTHGFLRRPTGTFVLFDFPGSTYTQANGITPEGTITGYYQDTIGFFHGFLRASNGTFRSLDFPPGVGIGPNDNTGTQPLAINPIETTTGYYSDNGGTPHGFIRYRSGKFVSFDPPGPLYYQQQIYPTAINPAGAITGWYYDSSSIAHGFLWVNGTFTPFDPVLGSTYTQAMAINPAGAITGWYEQCQSYCPPRAFLRLPNAPNSIITFDYPGTTAGTAAYAINPAGTITGNYTGTDSQQHGFIRHHNGTFISFDAPVPGFIYINPSAINPAGEITGSYLDGSFVQRGFLRIPAQSDE